MASHKELISRRVKCGEFPVHEIVEPQDSLEFILSQQAQTPHDEVTRTTIDSGLSNNLIDNVNTVIKQPTSMAGTVIAESQSNKLESLIANLIQSVEKSREDNKRENNATRELLLNEIKKK
jgi:hypothetical protein